MTHVERIENKPQDAVFVFANPAGGWDCYGPDEQLPPEQAARLGPQEESITDA